MLSRKAPASAHMKLLITFISGLVSGTLLLQLAAGLRRRRARLLAEKRWHGRRRPIIGVTGSGTHEELRLAWALGEWCALRGFHILTGGGGGVMRSVSRAYAQTREDQGGLVLAVLPGLPAAHAADWAAAREQVTSKLQVDQSSGALRCSLVLSSCLEAMEERIVPPRGYPNEFVDLAIHTHLPTSGGCGLSPLSRNHVSVLSADVLVALPGGAGTASEVELAVRYGVPVCRFLGRAGSIAGLSKAAAAASPAFAGLAPVQAFMEEALRRPRQPSSVPPGLHGRLTSCRSLLGLQ